MSKSFRLNKNEVEELKTKAMEINKQLINIGKEPMRDSEILHRILIKAIKRAEIEKDGTVRIKE